MFEAQNILNKKIIYVFCISHLVFISLCANIWMCSYMCACDYMECTCVAMCACVSARMWVHAILCKRER